MQRNSPHQWGEETPPGKAVLLTGTQESHMKNTGASLCQAEPQEMKSIAQRVCLCGVRQPLRLNMAVSKETG